MLHFIGIDWATDKHDICVLDEDGRVLSRLVIENNWQGFIRLETLLKSLNDVGINIERPNGLLVDWLIARKWSVYFVPPMVVAHHRPRRTKTDVYDAYLIANLLRQGNLDCRPIALRSTLAEQIHQVVRAYDQLENEKRRLSNRLRHVLKDYYPVLLGMFRRIDQPLTLEFLEHFPDPATARQATLDDLMDFFAARRYRYKERIPAHYERLQAVSPEARVSEGHVVHMLSLVAILRPIDQQQRLVRKKLQALFLSHEESDWWLSFPGVTTISGARLLGNMGDNRDRFESLDMLRAIAGTVPITRRSGKRTSVYFRKECSHPLRRAITDMARTSVIRSQWAREYYEQQKARGHGKPRAQRALANRWLGIIWKLWHTGEPYSEAVHLANRVIRGRPARKSEPEPVVAVK